MRTHLKEARIKAGFTQLEIAVRIGVSQQTVSKHESGKTTPKHFKIMREYEKLLGIQASELFPDVFV